MFTDNMLGADDDEFFSALRRTFMVDDFVEGGGRSRNAGYNAIRAATELAVRGNYNISGKNHAAWAGFGVGIDSPTVPIPPRPPTSNRYLSLCRWHCNLHCGCSELLGTTVGVAIPISGSECLFGVAIPISSAFTLRSAWQFRRSLVRNRAVGCGFVPTTMRSRSHT